MSSHPLVSCICVTHHSTEMLNRSVRCFQEQTYPNKELVIAFTSDNKDAITLLNKKPAQNIKTVLIPDNGFTLGEKRNWAIENSTGFYFCVWDDDDWYSNTRIEVQVKSLQGNPFKSTVLSSVILFDSKTSEAYRSATRWAWEQTLLCERGVFENTSSLRYPALERGEDSVLVYNLKEHNLLLTTHHPALYIYVYHGQNTWHRQHWEENFIRWATKLTASQSTLVQKLLNQDLDDQALVRSLDLELSAEPKAH
jgi:glycosyltransferase involved in cell wall biosynthesis